MNRLIDYRHRGQGAAPHAGNPVYAEFPVLCGFTRLDFELAFKVLQDYITTPHMTGRSKAHLDLMLTWGMKPELIVKGSDTVDLAGGHLQVLCHHL